MINNLPGNNSALIKSFKSLALLCVLLYMQAAAKQTMEKIVFSPNDSGVLITISFTPDVPEEFLIYYIIDNDNILLVTEFLNVVPEKDLSSNIQRPVTHVQAHCDSTKGYTLLQTLFYLEKEVPYKYRWNDNQFEIELLWQQPEIAGISKAYLLDIITEAGKDATVTISFIFDPITKDKSISLSADKNKIFIFFYNCEAPEGLQPQASPDLIEDMRIVQGNRNAPNPFTRIFIKTSQTITVQQYTKDNKFLLTIYTKTSPIIAGTSDPTEISSQSGETESESKTVAMRKSKKHKKWTYIGIGSGIVVGGTVLGILLGKKDDSGSSGSSDIPNIDVDLPDQRL